MRVHSARRSPLSALRSPRAALRGPLAAPKHEVRGPAAPKHEVRRACPAEARSAKAGRGTDVASRRPRRIPNANRRRRHRRERRRDGWRHDRGRPGGRRGHDDGRRGCRRHCGARQRLERRGRVPQVIRRRVAHVSRRLAEGSGRRSAEVVGPFPQGCRGWLAQGGRRFAQGGRQIAQGGRRFAQGGQWFEEEPGRRAQVVRRFAQVERRVAEVLGWLAQAVRRFAEGPVPQAGLSRAGTLAHQLPGATHGRGAAEPRRARTADRGPRRADPVRRTAESESRRADRRRANRGERPAVERFPPNRVIVETLTSRMRRMCGSAAAAVRLQGS